MRPSSNTSQHRNPVSLTCALIAACLLYSTPFPVYSAEIVWDYSATLFDLSGNDPLGIDGEQIDITLTFSTESVWEDYLFLEPASAVVSITGGHTASHKTTPIIKHGSFLTFSEGRNSGSFWDFVINGHVTVTKNDNIRPTSPIVPAVGDKLIEGHLPNSPSGILERISMSTSYSADSYGLNNASISVSTVPVPAAVWLFGSALAGLGWMRRKQIV
jgi:hypothetical protein